MQGQWFGRLERRIIILEIDEFEDAFRGNVQIHEYTPDGRHWLNVALGRVETPDKQQHGQIRTTLSRYNEDELDLSKVPFQPCLGLMHTVEYECDNNEFYIRLPEFNLEARLTNGCSQKSKYPLKPMCWREFKDYLDTNACSSERFIWRGQKKSEWPLRSSFHRHCRADSAQYLRFNLQRLRPYITSITKSKYDLSNTDDQIEFLSLVQHHGYPTPFLDWSLSPYIAAFFAFQNSQGVDFNAPYARIYWLNFHDWGLAEREKFLLACGAPQFTVLDAPPIHNPRPIPQQALSAFTNVADVESLFRFKQKQHNKEFLGVIDLPWSDRRAIMKDLRSMGITASSLFPGLDGICEAFKEQYFPTDQ